MKIVSCTSTKNNKYTPPSGVKIDKCVKCNTLVWSTREAAAAKKTAANPDGREIWCSECVEAKATPEDDILGNSIHNQNKSAPDKEVFTTLDDRINKQQKEIQELYLNKIDDQLGLVCSVAINNLAPNKDDEHLLLCCIVRTFVEQRLTAMREQMGPNATLVDVFNRFEHAERVSILTFIIGTFHAIRRSKVKDKFPSWNRKDNGQDEDYEASKDKNWKWES